MAATTTSMSSEEIKLCKFDVTVNKWHQWKGKFLEMAKTKGYHVILEGANNNQVPAETSENNNTADQITICCCNEIAYSHLMGLLDGVANDIVETCVTNDNLSGNAW